MEKLQISEQMKDSSNNKQELPNESQLLVPEMEYIQQERVTLDGMEFVTIARMIGVRRSDES